MTISTDPYVSDVGKESKTATAATVPTGTNNACFECVQKDAIIAQKDEIIDKLSAKLKKAQAFLARQRGERSVSRKVQRCQNDKDLIIAMRESRHSYKSIATLYGVSDQTIRRIIIKKEEI